MLLLLIVSGIGCIESLLLKFVFDFFFFFFFFFFFELN